MKDWTVKNKPRRKRKGSNLNRAKSYKRIEGQRRRDTHFASDCFSTGCKQRNSTNQLHSAPKVQCKDEDLIPPSYHLKRLGFYSIDVGKTCSFLCAYVIVMAIVTAIFRVEFNSAFSHAFSNKYSNSQTQRQKEMQLVENQSAANYL